MDSPTPDEIRRNMEAIREDLATLRLVQDKDSLVLYGDRDIHLLGLLERMEKVEDALKAIDSQKTLIKGMLVGLGLQGVGIIAILGKMFS